MIELERQGDVFVLTMTDGENRWNTTLCRELDAALDEVIASEGPAALVTASADTKFFSNGLDLGWITSRGEHPGGDRKAFNNEAMAVLAKMLTLPVPTVCAVNGHAFGAGLMLALGHDVRVMREDRGYLCANEIQLGFAIPAPELALFRSKMSMGAFHQTVQLAKRWSAAEALAEGIVQQTVPLEDVLSASIATATQLSGLAANREMFGWQKEQIYGADSALQHPHGAAHLLRNPDDYATGPGKIPSSPA
jgi:Delta3-Delta2-enoyl-CoA isomerase